MKRFGVGIAIALALLVSSTKVVNAQAQTFANVHYTMLDEISGMYGCGADVYFWTPRGAVTGCDIHTTREWWYKLGNDVRGPYYLTMYHYVKNGSAGILYMQYTDTVPITCQANEEPPYNFKILGFDLIWNEKAYSTLFWDNSSQQEMINFGEHTYHVN